MEPIDTNWTWEELAEEVGRLREALQRILDLNYGNESAKFIAEAALLETVNKTA